VVPGTADAIYQNIYMIEKDAPDHLLILAGDHIYKMDYAEMLRFHQHEKADATVAAIEVPIEQAPSFGVIAVEDNGRIVGFEEKPRQPKAIPAGRTWPSPPWASISSTRKRSLNTSGSTPCRTHRTTSARTSFPK